MSGVVSVCLVGLLGFFPSLFSNKRFLRVESSYALIFMLSTMLCSLLFCIFTLLTLLKFLRVVAMK